MNEIVSDNIVKSFRAFVNKFIETDDRLFDTLISNFEFMKVARKELLLEAGKTANKIFYLHEGYVRFFHTKMDGTEVTSDFYFAPGFITSFTSLIELKPSIVNIQVMVKMDVLFINYKDLMSLYDKEHKVKRLEIIK
jgi:CRP-like cAMP-binding protein